MTSLIKPALGTDPVKGWQYYSLHLASTYVLKEFFLASNYKSCIDSAMDQGDRAKQMMDAMEKMFGPNQNREFIVANAQGLSSWAVEMRQENYHQMHTHAFIGMFAAFEAGIEDTVTAIVLHDKQAASDAIGRFRKNLYSIADWPWSQDVCLEFAKKLEANAKSAAINGRIDLFERLKTLFSWLGVSMDADSTTIANLAEANRVRNLILHRYGEVGEEDAKSCPALQPWIGKVAAMDNDRFTNYYSAISNTLVCLVSGIAQSRHKGNGD